MATIERKQNSGRMSRIVIHGDTIYLSGHTASDPVSDVGEQTRQVLATIEERLAEAGSDKRHILSATIWLSDISTFQEMNAVWDAWVDGDAAPARATVEARLAKPELLVEMSMIASAVERG